jgi:hypothetical protein
VAESVLVRHQLLVLNHGRKRGPSLRAADRIIAGLRTLFMRPARVLRSASALKPSHSAASAQFAEETKVPRVVFACAGGGRPVELQIGRHEVFSDINVRRHLVQAPIELLNLIGARSFFCKLSSSGLEKLTNLENVPVEQVPLLPWLDIRAALRAHFDHPLWPREHLDRFSQNRPAYTQVSAEIGCNGQQPRVSRELRDE